MAKINYLKGYGPKTIPLKVRRGTVYEVGKMSRFPSFRRKTNKDLIESFEEKTINSKQKHFTNQADRIVYITKIEMQRLVAVPICLMMTVLAGVVLGFCFYSSYYEYIDYDIDKLNETLRIENNAALVSMDEKVARPNSSYYWYNLTREANGEYHILTRITFHNSFEHVNDSREFFLYESHSSLWNACNSLSGKFS